MQQTVCAFFVLICFLGATVGPLSTASAADQPEQQQTNDDDNVQAFEGLVVHQWAAYPLLANPVGITFDAAGRAYVTETARRKTSNLDIRQHRYWMTEDLSFQSVKDKQEFLHKRLSASREVAHDWLEDRNKDGVSDWKDLTVQSERVHRVVDTDGDGTADTSTVFAEGFNTEVTGVGAGVLAQGDNVYFTAAPDLWRLRDNDEDGTADTRKSISRGYGVHFGYAGHDMSGVTMGPDGKIYWSIGDIGLNVTDSENRRWVYPNQGAVMRANPDGTDFEVFAHGLRNPQEIAFDKYGNLISVDNDGDRSGEHERIVYITEGSDTGWRMNWQFGKYGDKNASDYNVWMDERLHHKHFEEQAAYITPPVALYHDGPAGFAYNPGTALSPKWRDHFFVSLFTGSASRAHINAFKLAPEGASFKLTKDQKIVEGVLTTGITFAPNGALYLADWGSGWNIGAKGRIWEVDVPTDQQTALRTNTKQLLRAGMEERSLKELRELLHHEDMRVRMNAQFELVGLAEAGKEQLLEVARRSDHQLARLHAVWGLGQLGRKKAAAVAPLVELLNDEDSEVRAQVAKVIGEAGYTPAVDQLLPLLREEAARPKFFAAIALGKIGASKAFDPLVAMLTANAGKDPYLRHAGITGLTYLNNPAAVVELSAHESPEVRRAAVVVLRRLKHKGVEAFLQDSDELVLAEAARAIHDDFSIPAALPELAQVLERKNLTNEALLRRAINANLRLGKASHAERLADYAARSSAPEEMRAEALAVLSFWANPNPLDRVTGRYRGLKPRDRAVAVKAVKPLMEVVWSSSSDTVQVTSAQMVARLNHKPAGKHLFELFSDRAAKPHVRTAALRALAELNHPRLEKAVSLALEDDQAVVRAEAIQQLSVLDPSGTTAVTLYGKILENGQTKEKQYALQSLAEVDNTASQKLLSRWMDKLIAGTADKGIHLDLLEAVRKSRSKTLAKKLHRYEAAQDDIPTANYQATLFGGDAQKGRTLVFEHTAAQCIRCHAIGEEGGTVGPSLTTVGSRASRQYLLESLVQPGAKLAAGYGVVTLTLQDGTVLTGTLHEETSDAVVLEKGDGTLRKVRKAQISERQNAPSAMPPMGGILDKTEIRDVIEYLTTLKGEER